MAGQYVQGRADGDACRRPFPARPDPRGTGKRDVAKTDYQAALAINPKNDDYKKALAALK
jgi:hypothetical protein